MSGPGRVSPSRRLVSVMAALVVAGGCSPSVGEANPGLETVPAEVTTTSPTAAPTSAAPSTTIPTRSTAAAVEDPPVTWVGARVEGEEMLVVLVDDTETILAREPHSYPEIEDTIDASDIARAGDTVLVAMCCEPTSGSIYSVPVGDGEAELELADQGYRLDVNGSVLARTDTTGILEIRPHFPTLDGRWADSEAHAADVSVGHGGDQIAILLDPERMVGASTPEGEPSVVVYELENGEATPATTFPVEPGEYCALAHLAGDQIALLVSDGQAEAFGCTGSALDVLDLESGEVSRLLDVDNPVRHLGVDETGHFITLTSVEGAVRWHALTGDSGVLAESGFLAADW